MVKTPPAVQEMGSIPESPRSPREGNGNLLQYSCLENFMERGVWGLQSMGSQRVRHDSDFHFRVLNEFLKLKGAFVNGNSE